MVKVDTTNKLYEKAQAEVRKLRTTNGMLEAENDRLRNSLAFHTDRVKAVESRNTGLETLSVQV